MLAGIVVVTVALAASVLAQSPLTINTPWDAHRCETTMIAWKGGERSFFLRSTEVVESFGTLGSNAFFWNTNVPAGDEIQMELIDATGKFVLSAPFVIQPGSNNCTLL
ncbi:uncharacterized protein TRAVEDRAFT_54062 [Trametes versicolor FP-101664 SS1]|uniref:Uncharacterized protein n=1 Tax=Trametes versicolor (strain FP-101664) TaxID=717944 RepID=R7SAZ6_TRAVS|nr:uncharacterized protein TRAVEDRAFT_54062 [Trametes versicolor FP-101664 SS1]EIW52084.1 hypothetical protein TRAVEDRAFT_54062 [Trametes versicolor FP-101664 SS1]